MNDPNQRKKVDLVFNQNLKKIITPPHNISNWKEWKSCSTCGIEYREDEELGMRNCRYHPKRFNRTYGYYQCCRNATRGIHCKGCQEKDHMENYQPWIMLSESALEIIHNRRQRQQYNQKEELFHPDSVLKTYPEYPEDDSSTNSNHLDDEEEEEEEEEGDNEEDDDDDESEEDDDESENGSQNENDKFNEDRVENYMLICRDSYCDTSSMIETFDKINHQGEIDRNAPKGSIIQLNKNLNPFRNRPLISPTYF